MLKAWMMLAAIAVASAADAQEAAGTGLSIQLNSAQTLAEPLACRLTFFIENGTDTSLGQVTYEIGVSDTAGRFEFISFSFGAIPSGRPRLRRFDLAGTPCDEISSILLQEPSCIDTSGADVSATVCEAALSLSSHPDVAIDLL